MLHGCHSRQRVDVDETLEGSVGPRRFTCLATTTAASAIGDSVKGVSSILPVFRLSRPIMRELDMRGRHVGGVGFALGLHSRV